MVSFFVSNLFGGSAWLNIGIDWGMFSAFWVNFVENVEIAALLCPWILERIAVKFQRIIWLIIIFLLVKIHLSWIFLRKIIVFFLWRFFMFHFMFSFCFRVLLCFLVNIHWFLYSCVNFSKECCVPAFGATLIFIFLYNGTWNRLIIFPLSYFCLMCVCNVVHELMCCAVLSLWFVFYISEVFYYHMLFALRWLDIILSRGRVNTNMNIELGIPGL